MNKLTRRAVLALIGAAGLAGGYYLWVRYAMRAADHADIAYGTGARHKLDIYLPAGAGPHPFVVDIHGGAFKMGDKTMSAATEQILAAGIAIVRINYRLTGTDIWPAQLDDCLAAVAFLRSNGGNYGLDPARMALWGQSAGGFLAVSTALSLVQAGQPPQAVIDFFGPMVFGEMDSDMAALGKTAAMGTADIAESPESVLLGYPVGENRERANAAGPVGRLAAATGLRLPPIMIRHGEADPLIAPTQSERLRDAWAAQDATAEVDFALVPAGGHGGGDFNEDAVLLPTAAFLTKHLAAK
jgi:acetyl esterase/lipase